MSATINQPDAAAIVQPGRAYLQVGNNEVYELFQSAWSGASYRKDARPEEGNILYAASSGYGKTAFLTTAALSLALKNRVEALQFYILDFGNSGLIPLNRLHHTADYITFEDSEKLQKFMAEMEKETKKRRKLLADAMAQNFELYNRGNENPMKAVVILLDNYDVVKELGMETEEFFQKLSRDGARLGIFLLATATRSAAMKYGTFNNFKNRIAGFLFEAVEVNNVVGRSSLKQSEKKGRVLAKWNGSVHAVQLYLAADCEDEADYGRRLGEVIGRINSLYPDTKAPRLAILPETLTQKNLAGYEGSCLFKLGLHKETVQAMGITDKQPLFVILGDAGRGKTTMIKVILSQIKPEQTVYLFDSPSMELYGEKERENLHYIGEETDAENFAAELERELADRNARMKAWLSEEKNVNPRTLAERFPDIHILVDDWDYMVERIKDKAALAGLFRSCAGAGIRIIATASCTRLKGFDELTRFVKTGRNGLLMGSPGTTGMFPVRTQRELPEPGDGLLFADGAYERVKLAAYEE